VNQETIIEREIVNAIGSLDPDDDGFVGALQVLVRDRLTARATLGELTTSHTCPAAHSTAWGDVLVVVVREPHALAPLAFTQCPECVDTRDLQKSPLDWAEFSMKLATPHARWIWESADERLKEIAGALGKAKGVQHDNLLRERKIVESIAARMRLKLDNL
jgi:hypothetical protein